MENKETVLIDLAQRMSLRPPQKESLERLAASVEAAGLKKGATVDELEAQLASVRALNFEGVDLPPAADFDWQFLSFAFALATGVGKTRLMGAIIAYLYRVKGLRNFVVIAPGKTVYEKLIADFTEGTLKYVFKGISCFANAKPIVVTGETYQNGAGLIEGQDLLGHSIVINVFNIQKLNERNDREKSHDDSQKDVAKIRRVNETLGMSYFDYLKSREDLVVLMDEAHHYRADEAARTVNEMQPVLGIEMTATPRDRNGNRQFGNILFEYGLAKAMQDGFVKEPAVVLRKSFRSGDYAGREEELDHLKLQDAMIVHEHTKTALGNYACNKGLTPIKPFVLVVVPDQAYADTIETYIKSSAFYGGKYAGKVIKVYAKTGRGAGMDDAELSRLLEIEHPLNTVEIVIHVNKLTEGWDVTNLYTIVPLRPAISPTFVEQTIGRGLRLPYGKLTGDPEIDTLSIVSHDKFDEIIAAAQNLRVTMKSREVPTSPKAIIMASPKIVTTTEIVPAEATLTVDTGTQAALTAIGELVSSETATQGVNLLDEQVQTKIATAVTKALTTPETQPTSEQVAASLSAALSLVHDAMIEIPNIKIRPGDTTMRFCDFELDIGRIMCAPRDDGLVLVGIPTGKKRHLNESGTYSEVTEPMRLQYVQDVARVLSAYDDIDYDACSELAGRLIRTCIDCLVAKLTPDAMANCMRNNVRTLAACIRIQLLEHAEYDSAKDIVCVQNDFKLKANPLEIVQGEEPRPFNVPLADGEKSTIKNMVFSGFSKCLFTLQKFDSDPERAFSVILEREASVQKWFKPTLSNLQLHYATHEYTPDFVVETDTQKLLVEVKASDQIDNAKVQLKKDAAIKWCHYANENLPDGGKTWQYLLIPDIAINSSLELAQAIRDYAG